MKETFSDIWKKPMLKAKMQLLKDRLEIKHKGTLWGMKIPKVSKNKSEKNF